MWFQIHYNSYRALLGRLDTLKQSTGETVHWSSKGESPTYGYGNTIAVEATALAASAYMAAGFKRDEAMKALAWLVEQKKLDTESV